MARPYGWPAEVRAQFIALILQGETTKVAAEKVGIPKSTGDTWRNAVRKGKILANDEKQKDVGEMAFVLLQESLITLVEQVKLFRDPTWVHSQTASDMAVLWGVASDKAFRLLAAVATQQRDAELEGGEEVRQLEGPNGETPEEIISEVIAS